MRPSTIFSSLARRAFSISAAISLFLAAGAAADAGPLALYVTDSDVIHGFDATTGAPLPGFSDIALSGATGLTVGPDGNLYAANTNPAQVFRYNPATGAQIGPSPFVSFNGQNDGHDVQNPQGMRFGPGGNLFIADVTLSNVHVYNSVGNSLGSIEGNSLVQPTDVTVDAAGTQVFAVTGNANVLVSSGVGQPFVDFTAQLAGGLINPVSLSFGPDHDLYVLDVGGGAPKVVRFAPDGTPAGTVVSFAGNNPFNPAYLAIGPDGKLYLSGQDLNTAAGEILKFGLDGTPLGTFIGTGLVNPTFMAFSVPEPSTFALGIAGLAALGCVTLRKKLRRA